MQLLNGLLKDLKIEVVKWHDAENHLRQIRANVFIEEQNVPEELEWDEYDQDCVHVIVWTNNIAIATGRLLEAGQIGRMAVLKKYRNTGIGKKVLAKLLSIAEVKNLENVFLHSQVKAIEFYKKFGFEVEGDVFDDAGIPHIKMTKKLDK